MSLYLADTANTPPRYRCMLTPCAMATMCLPSPRLGCSARRLGLDLAAWRLGGLVAWRLDGPCPPPGPPWPPLAPPGPWPLALVCSTKAARRRLLDGGCSTEAARRRLLNGGLTARHGSCDLTARHGGCDLTCAARRLRFDLRGTAAAT
ncbi:hypothetical protein T492DRAFT_128725 [Pavlovales sp. CCMP2436]|nr:hypothetical protein T492DRAFT_128725 [Pavlovales sp. CCMP2436]